MYSSPVGINKVKITDEFWAERVDTVREKVIPYQWEILNDRVADAEPSYCMHNFIAAGDLNQKKQREGDGFAEPVYTFRGFQALPDDPDAPEPDRFYGFVFQDSDFSKWIEAVGYSLMVHPDEELERIADGAIDIVCRAQAENGYLDTYYILNGMDKIFTNLRDHHELYCLGHLIEGAAAYYEGTGKDRLLKAACRFADFVCEKFGPGDRLHGYPGHEIAEMALFKLYEITGEEKYKALASYFIDERGAEPSYFNIEHKDDPGGDTTNLYYHQAHLPVRKQTEATGHAVRAVYLYSGMADMARLTGDEELKNACERLWDSIVDEKLYITGGIGGTHLGEAFSFPYDLPNDTAYSETCAAIGLVFFAHRMLRMEPDRKYSDIMELSLYNTVMAGMAIDGQSFFYVNPLEVDPTACKRDERKLHVKPVRQKWFGCACCPPNIARTTMSIARYAYTISDNETSDAMRNIAQKSCADRAAGNLLATDKTLFVHLYMSSEITLDDGAAHDPENKIFININSDIIRTSEVTVSITKPEKSSFVMAFRIPGWCRDHFSVNGTDGEEYSDSIRSGYLYIPITKSEETLRLKFEIEPVFMESADEVSENAGRVTLMRGPFVYCVEECDNGKALHELAVDTAGGIRIYNEDLSEKDDHDTSSDKADDVRIKRVFERSIRLVTGGRRVTARGEKMPGSKLYHIYEKPEETKTDIIWIPYYLWANRGEGEMRVYLANHSAL
ncbi:MAG: glycoside hydrolase family 127 protein [Eubacterium sp.]|nr:glycoside hydrolase family 127 protein [Eubacterium sp.]